MCRLALGAGPTSVPNNIAARTCIHGIGDVTRVASLATENFGRGRIFFNGPTPLDSWR